VLDCVAHAPPPNLYRMMEKRLKADVQYSTSYEDR